ncbi:hypothetical protein EUTSA_v10002747mg [Eutrema salsugineum]|uniref:FAD-binding domain-containing protein n=1 Tax=Eutrema salsugineum TaxID=72664 RepID=V4L0B6_EUTSA|nr:hypothetical protein EUTSA_v10002747mg [Eutrema salsugineum]
MNKRKQIVEHEAHRFYGVPREDTWPTSRRALVGAKAGTALVEEEKREIVKEKKKLRVLVAGGGIRGLVFALAAKKKGIRCFGV